MDHNAYPRMTALDQVICDDSLQAMKAVIPYTPFRFSLNLWNLKRRFSCFGSRNRK